LNWPPKVKFCGMTRREDIQQALALGVDYIGVILVPNTQRTVSLEAGRALREQIGDTRAMVCVVRDATAEYVQAVINQVQPDFIQFHGAESEAFCLQFGHPYFKVVSVQAQANVGTDPLSIGYQSAHSIIFDSHSTQGGGMGLRFDWQLLGSVKPVAPQQFGLAGGLDPNNIVSTKPRVLAGQIQLLDVSSGIESSSTHARGIKSLPKMRQFMSQLAG